MRVIRCTRKIAEVDLLMAEALRGIWPCECWVDHIEGHLCLSLCQGLLWRLGHLQVPQWHCFYVVIARTIMQSSQLINWSILSARWLQDHS